MTALGPGGSGPLTVVQAEPGFIGSAPSASPAGAELPAQSGSRLRRGPDRDPDGRPLWLATPSPCPPGGVLLAAAPVENGKAAPDPGRYALYLAPDDWPDQDAPAKVEMQLLFDDPELVDAEPVAAYPRKANIPPAAPTVTPAKPTELTLLGGRSYRGPVGAVMATGLYAAMMNDLPGQKTDAGEGPIFAPAPLGKIDHVRVYASRRDRFDDPARPRVPGGWEAVVRLPGSGETAGGSLPTDAPTVLAGFGSDGKVVKWTTGAKDKAGRQATFYAFAGDHYSLTVPSGMHMCVGCHPGHSGFSRVHHTHAERLDK
jgi:hypothetical protein